MGWLSFFFGGKSSSGRRPSGSDGRRCAKDGTCFQNAKDGSHVVIERRGGGAPSVGHNRRGGRRGKK
jgi:hypothetical protein